MEGGIPVIILSSIVLCVSIIVCIIIFIHLNKKEKYVISELQRVTRTDPLNVYNKDLNTFKNTIIEMDEHVSGEKHKNQIYPIGSLIYIDNTDGHIKDSDLMGENGVVEFENDKEIYLLCNGAKISMNGKYRELARMLQVNNSTDEVELPDFTNRMITIGNKIIEDPGISSNISYSSNALDTNEKKKNLPNKIFLTPDFLNEKNRIKQGKFNGDNGFDDSVKRFTGLENDKKRRGIDINGTLNGFNAKQSGIIVGPGGDFYSGSKLGDEKKPADPKYAQDLLTFEAIPDNSSINPKNFNVGVYIKAI